MVQSMLLMLRLPILLQTSTLFVDYISGHQNVGCDPVMTGTQFPEGEPSSIR